MGGRGKQGLACKALAKLVFMTAGTVDSDEIKRCFTYPRGNLMAKFCPDRQIHIY